MDYHHNLCGRANSPARSHEDCPFDERSEPSVPPVKKKNRHTYFQTAEPMRALSQMEYSAWPSATPVATPSPSPPSAPQQPRPWTWDSYTSFPRLGSPSAPAPLPMPLYHPVPPTPSVLPMLPPRATVSTSSMSSTLTTPTTNRMSSALPPLPRQPSTTSRPYKSWSNQTVAAVTPPHQQVYPLQSMSSNSIQPVGHPSLGVYRGRLPEHIIATLPALITKSEAAAAATEGHWKTNLYSLTKQDLPVRQIPGSQPLVEPIQAFILDHIRRLYHSPNIRMDKNQPHVLKYSAAENHTGVQLHHDRCDVTANLVLSDSSAYAGGGTFYPAIGDTLRLERGEFVLHPGSLVHAGTEITAGTRHLLVFFCHLEGN